MSKRIRSVNWHEEEKQLLRSVLKDFTQIIEDKTLTTNTNKLKAKAWEEVHQRFNSLNSRERDLNQLKIQWKGMKMYVRNGNYKRESNKTGGGAGPATPDDAIIEILDMLNPARFPGDRKSTDKTEVLATPLGNIARKKPARNLMQSKMRNSALKSQKDNEDYIIMITRHSKELKDKEHAKRMAMAEEKHDLEVAILKENLRTAQLERQITEKKLEKLMSNEM